MKEILKLFLTLILVIISILGLIILIDVDNDKVYAASSSTSDLQLMARAINGEARGEPYEGQVAVRCSYFKPCKKLTISKYYSRGNI